MLSLLWRNCGGNSTYKLNTATIEQSVTMINVGAFESTRPSGINERPGCYNSGRIFRKVSMDIQTIVSDLKYERNRIDQAISALEGLTSPAPRRGGPPKAGHRLAGNVARMSIAARKRIAEAMKQRWAKWKGKSAPKKAVVRRPMRAAAKKCQHS